MNKQDIVKFYEFKEMFLRYLDPDDLSEQETILREDIIQFIKNACIKSLVC